MKFLLFHKEIFQFFKMVMKQIKLKVFYLSGNSQMKKVIINF